MNTIISTIINSYKSVRTETTLQSFMESLLTLLVCKKISPGQIQALYNMGAVNQVEEISIIYEHCKKKYPHLLQTLRYTNIQSVLEKQLSLIAQIDDDILFAQALRTVIRKNIRDFSFSTASNNEVNIFKALVEPCDTHTLGLPAAGMATLVSVVNAKEYYLQEANTTVYTFSQALLFLENKKVHFTLGNSLLEAIQHKGVDIAIAIPPMGLRLQLTTEQPAYPLLVQGAIPASGSDSLWIQRVLASLNDTGKAFIQLAPGWFFRGGYDGKVRDALLKNEYIEAVISLPQGILENSQISPYILVLNKNRSKGAPIHFVDGTHLGNREQHKLTLSQEDCATLASLVRGEMPDDERCAAKYLSEIRQADGSKGNILTVSNFIHKNETIVKLNVFEELDKLKVAFQEFENAQAELKSIISHI